MEIKLVMADIDGTLISGGKPETLPSELIDEVRKIREQGVLFSLVSGRDKAFQERLREQIFGSKDVRELEALIYEESSLVLGNGIPENLAGLSKDLLARVDAFYGLQPLIFEGMVPLPNTNFEFRRSYVTKEFARGERTNDIVLQRAYESAKNFARILLPGVKVVRSADGLDFLDPKAHKGLAFERYLSILRGVKITPRGILVVGDSTNDLEVIERNISGGGKAAFVGENTQLIERLARRGAYISNQKGPLGALESIRYYTK